MGEAGTKQAFKAVFETGKVHTDLVERRLIARIEALEKSVKELRSLYEARLNKMKIDHKKQTDISERNDKMLMSIIGTQKQITYLAEQNNAIMDSNRKLMEFIHDVASRYGHSIEVLEDKVKCLEIEDDK